MDEDKEKAQRLLLAKKKLKRLQESRSGLRDEVVSLGSSSELVEGIPCRPSSEPSIFQASQADAIPVHTAGLNGFPDLSLQSEAAVPMSTSAELLQLNNENYQPSGATSVSLDFTNDISNQLFQQNNENYIPSGSAHSLSLDFMNDISGQSVQRVGHKSGNESVPSTSREALSQQLPQSISMTGAVEQKIEMTALKECVSQYRMEIVHLNELLQYEKRKGNSYELEKSNMATMNQKLQGKIIQLTIENEKLSAQDLQFRQEMDLLRGDNCVINEKLVSKDAELAQANSQIDALTSELSLARLNLEQLKNSATPVASPPDYELLKSKCVAYENELEEYRSRLTVMKSQFESGLREQQEYAIVMNQKRQDLEHQVNDLLMENKRLLTREADLEQNLALNNIEIAKHTEEIKQKTFELESCKTELKSVNQVQNDLSLIRRQLDNTLRDNNDLTDVLRRKNIDLESCSLEINHLHEQIESLKLETTQYSREKYESLVNQLQSDRVATSRALSQNKEMKERLFELEQRLINVMDEKVNLTEELESARRLAATSNQLLEVTSAGTEVAVDVLKNSCIRDENWEREEGWRECEKPTMENEDEERILGLEIEIQKLKQGIMHITNEKNVLHQTVIELLEELKGKNTRSKQILSLINKRFNHFDKERLLLRNQVDELILLLNAFLDSSDGNSNSSEKFLKLLNDISNNQILSIESVFVNSFKCGHCMGLQQIV